MDYDKYHQEFVNDKDGMVEEAEECVFDQQSDEGWELEDEFVRPTPK